METIVIILIAVPVTLAVVSFFASFFGSDTGKSMDIVDNMPSVARASKPRWQVKFAGDWYECDLVGDNGNIGKLVRVHLKGRPCHLTTCLLPDEIRQVQ